MLPDNVHVHCVWCILCSDNTDINILYNSSSIVDCFMCVVFMYGSIAVDCTYIHVYMQLYVYASLFMILDFWTIKKRKAIQ